MFLKKCVGPAARGHSRLRIVAVYLHTAEQSLVGDVTLQRQRLFFSADVLALAFEFAQLPLVDGFFRDFILELFQVCLGSLASVTPTTDASELGPDQPDVQDDEHDDGDDDDESPFLRA